MGLLSSLFMELLEYRYSSSQYYLKPTGEYTRVRMVVRTTRVLEFVSPERLALPHASVETYVSVRRRRR